VRGGVHALESEWNDFFSAFDFEALEHLSGANGAFVGHRRESRVCFEVVADALELLARAAQHAVDAF
jgi:hypothetical protein